MLLMRNLKTLNIISVGDCAFCTLYVVLFAVFLTKNVIIVGVFVYFYWYKKYNGQSHSKNSVRIKFNPNTQAANY